MAIEETQSLERKNAAQNSFSTIRTKESASTKGSGSVKIPKLTLPPSSKRRTASSGRDAKAGDSKYKPYRAGSSASLVNLRAGSPSAGRASKPLSKRGSTPIVPKPGKQPKGERHGSASRHTDMKVAEEGRSRKAKHAATLKSLLKPPHPQKPLKPQKSSHHREPSQKRSQRAASGSSNDPILVLGNDSSNVANAMST